MGSPATTSPVKRREGAPVGNKNAAKGTWFRDILRKALEEEDRATRKKNIEAVALKLIEVALEGDVAAIREIADRIDGKAKQPITGEDGQPLVLQFTVSRSIFDGL